MKVHVVVKLSCQSKEEAMGLPQTHAQAQAQFEHMRAQGVFGPPEHAEVRFLLVPGVWDRG